MSNPVNIFNKLQLKVFNKANKLKVTDEVTSSSFTSQYKDEPEDDNIDVPDVTGADDTYTTHQTVGLPGYTSRGNRLPLESRKNIKEVDEPSDDVPDPSELAAGSDEGGGGGEEAIKTCRCRAIQDT